MSDTPQKPHQVHYSLDADGMTFGWEIDCPYVGKGPRPCLLISEVGYEECPSWFNDGECELLEDNLAGYNEDFGHGHAIDGCAVIEYLSATSMGEAVVFCGEFRVVAPITVTVGWQGNDGIVLTPTSD